MEIRHMRITNFRGLKSADFTPEKLNVFLGASGSGKSSILDALRYGITGKRCPNQIHSDAFDSTVTVDIERIGQVHRRITSSGKSEVYLAGKKTTAKSVDEQMETAFEVHPADINMLTSSQVLEHALGKDLAEYLLNSGFLANDMPYSRLLALNPLENHVANELERTMFPHSGTTRDHENVTLELIEAAYQQYRSSRPALKRMLADETAKASMAASIPARSLEEITQDLTDNQSKIGAERRAAIEYPKAVKETESLTKSIAETEAKLAAMSSVKPVTEREKKLAASNLTNAQKLVNDTMVAIASGTNEIKVLEKTVHSLNTSVCPISQSLVCTTDKTSVKEELTAALEMKRDAVDILHDKLEGYQQTVHDAKEAVDACVAQEKAYQAKLDLMKLLSSLKTVKVTIPKKPDPKTLEALEHRNEELRKEQADAMQYEIIKSHAKRAESLKTELEVAETLVKELAPSGGIRKQVLAHSIGPMEDVCNECMKTLLPKYRLLFNPDDNFNISVQDVSLPGVTFSFDALSRGEQLSVLFILMLMLNQVNQVRIICMDNLNDLDVEALKRFLKVVEDVDPSYYDHIFLSSIDHEGFIEVFDKCKIDHAIFECHAKTISRWTTPGTGC